jgi:hypothetical protein
MKYNLLFYLLGLALASYRINVLHTPIFDFLPRLKLHHVVILKKDSSIYAVDFTPIRQGSLVTSLKFFLGFNEPAEIRVISIKKVDFNDTKTLINVWKNIKDDCTYSLEKNNDLLTILRDWKNDSMNLYCHNCQHFSHFVKKKIAAINL